MRISHFWTRIYRVLGGWRALIWLPVGLSLGAACILLFSAGEIYDYQDTVDGVHLPQVDAIVCLAGGRGRISFAGDLWYRYWEQSKAQLPKVVPVPKVVKDSHSSEVPTLFLSGLGFHANFQTFSKQIRRGVLEVLKPEKVILETESMNTQENAEYLARFAKDRGWKHILLVTSSYHMRRSRFIFENVLRAAKLENVKVETLSVIQEPYEAGEWRGQLQGIRVTVLEYLKWLYYRGYAVW